MLLSERVHQYCIIQHTLMDSQDPADQEIVAARTAVYELSGMNKPGTCPVCLFDLPLDTTKMAVYPCLHAMCYGCYKDYLKRKGPDCLFQCDPKKPWGTS